MRISYFKKCFGVHFPLVNYFLIHIINCNSRDFLVKFMLDGYKLLNHGRQLAQGGESHFIYTQKNRSISS